MPFTIKSIKHPSLGEGLVRLMLKWAIGVVLTPFILIVLLAVALYLPPIQNWAVKTVAAYASEEIGMEVSVERVCLVFPLNLGVDGVKVIQQNDSLPQRKDTIADLKRAVVDVQLMPLFDSQVNIDQLDIYELKMNTANLVHEARVKGRVGELTLKPASTTPNPDPSPVMGKGAGRRWGKAK